MRGPNTRAPHDTPPPVPWRARLGTRLAKARSLRRRLSFAVRSLGSAQGRFRVTMGILSRVQRPIRSVASGYRRTLIRRTRFTVVIGSFGKSTTTRAIAAAFDRRPAVRNSWNSGVAVSIGILRTRTGTPRAVMEIGIAEPNQMTGYAQLIRPDIVVATTIGSEHHNSLGTLEQTRAEKAKMVQALPESGYAILNADDPHILWMRSVTKATVITYGLGEAADVLATDIIADAMEGTSFVLHLDGASHKVRIRLVGRHMVYSILAAIAVARVEGVKVQTILDRLGKLQPMWNRLQPIRHTSGAWILLDAFKSAEETIERALDTLDELRAKRKLIVLGDVEEPRGSQGPIYRSIGMRVAQVADRAVFVGGKTNFNRLKVGTKAGGMPREALTNVRGCPLEVIGVLKREIGPDDVVLIKGRCTQHLERIALGLIGQDVGCGTRFCSRRHTCTTCPYVRRGP